MFAQLRLSSVALCLALKRVGTLVASTKDEKRAALAGYSTFMANSCLSAERTPEACQMRNQSGRCTGAVSKDTKRKKSNVQSLRMLYSPSKAKAGSVASVDVR